MDIKNWNKKLLTQILLALFVLISSLCLYDVQLMTPFSWFLLVSLLVIRCFTCPIAGENNVVKILLNIYLFILGWSVVWEPKEVFTPVEAGFWLFFGWFAPLLDTTLLISRFWKKENENIVTKEENPFLELVEGGVYFTLLGILVFMLILMFKPNYLAEKPEETQKVQEVVPTNETHNGIAFEVISKRLVNEAYLRGFGIPSMGNSPVLVITVKLKNNGKEPYKPHIKARLLDENGAIYAGNVYTNVIEILNSSQNILNPGMEKTEVLYFKIPEKKNFTIEFQDGTFFSDTVSIKL